MIVLDLGIRAFSSPSGKPGNSIRIAHPGRIGGNATANNAGIVSPSSCVLYSPSQRLSSSGTGDCGPLPGRLLSFSTSAAEMGISFEHGIEGEGPSFWGQ